MRTQIDFHRLTFPKHLSAEERFSLKATVDGGVLGFSIVDTEAEAIVNIQGVIGDEFEGVTALDLVPAIQGIQKPIRMRISTPGGYVNQAIDAFDAIANHPHHVTADITEASSAGTIFAAAADKTRIATAGTYMIHEPWTGFVIMGNRHEIRQQMAGFMAQNLETLDKLSEQLAQIVSTRTKASIEDVRAWMDGKEGQDGTTFVGQEAIDAGLVDELIPTPERKEKAEKMDFERRARVNAIKLMQISRGHFSDSPTSIDRLTRKTETAQ